MIRRRLPRLTAAKDILNRKGTGEMTGGGYPDLIRPFVDGYLESHRGKAMEAYARVLP